MVWCWSGQLVVARPAATDRWILKKENCEVRKSKVTAYSAWHSSIAKATAGLHITLGCFQNFLSISEGVGNCNGLSHADILLTQGKPSAPGPRALLKPEVHHAESAWHRVTEFLFELHNFFATFQSVLCCAFMVWLRLEVVWIVWWDHSRMVRWRCCRGVF